jgi:hypothetical protein
MIRGERREVKGGNGEIRTIGKEQTKYEVDNKPPFPRIPLENQSKRRWKARTAKCQG